MAAEPAAGQVARTAALVGADPAAEAVTTQISVPRGEGATVEPCASCASSEREQAVPALLTRPSAHLPPPSAEADTLALTVRNAAVAARGVASVLVARHGVARMAVLRLLLLRKAVSCQAPRVAEEECDANQLPCFGFELLRALCGIRPKRVRGTRKTREGGRRAGTSRVRRRQASRLRRTDGGDLRRQDKGRHARTGRDEFDSSDDESNSECEGETEGEEEAEVEGITEQSNTVAVKNMGGGGGEGSTGCGDSESAVSLPLSLAVAEAAEAAESAEAAELSGAAGAAQAAQVARLQLSLSEAQQRVNSLVREVQMTRHVIEMTRVENAADADADVDADLAAVEEMVEQLARGVQIREEIQSKLDVANRRIAELEAVNAELVADATRWRHVAERLRAELERATLSKRREAPGISMGPPISPTKEEDGTEKVVERGEKEEEESEEERAEEGAEEREEREEGAVGKANVKEETDAVKARTQKQQEEKEARQLVESVNIRMAAMGLELDTWRETTRQLRASLEEAQRRIQELALVGREVVSLQVQLVAAYARIAELDRAVAELESERHALEDDLACARGVVGAVSAKLVGVVREREAMRGRLMAMIRRYGGEEGRAEEGRGEEGIMGGKEGEMKGEGHEEPGVKQQQQEEEEGCISSGDKESEHSQGLEDEPVRGEEMADDESAGEEVRGRGERSESARGMSCTSGALDEGDGEKRGGKGVVWANEGSEKGSEGGSEDEKGSDKGSVEGREEGSEEASEEARAAQQKLATLELFEAVAAGVGRTERGERAMGSEERVIEEGGLEEEGKVQEGGLEGTEMEEGEEKVDEEGGTSYDDGVVECDGKEKGEGGEWGKGKTGEGKVVEGRAGDGRMGDGRMGDGRMGDGRMGDGRMGDEECMPGMACTHGLGWLGSGTQEKGGEGGGGGRTGGRGEQVWMRGRGWRGGGGRGEAREGCSLGGSGAVRRHAAAGSGSLQVPILPFKAAAAAAAAAAATAAAGRAAGEAGEARALKATGTELETNGMPALLLQVVVAAVVVVAEGGSRVGGGVRTGEDGGRCCMKMVKLLLGCRTVLGEEDATEKLGRGGEECTGN
ncbi:unnamed protein product [Closterium sp. Naga37s-1]|nr:unnamed protein product [Closterium sp. Naga37s-1]